MKTASYKLVLREVEAPEEFPSADAGIANQSGSA